jgi:hypothetical protein
MTGYESKRAAARDRMIDDDDTQVYQQAAAFIAAAFIAAEERKVGTQYGYVPKLHQSEYMDEQPAQRTWVGLTDKEAQWLYDNCGTPSNLIDMVEAKLKEKNT